MNMAFNVHEFLRNRIFNFTPFQPKIIPCNTKKLYWLYFKWTYYLRSITIIITITSELRSYIALTNIITWLAYIVQLYFQLRTFIMENKNYIRNISFLEMLSLLTLIYVKANQTHIINQIGEDNQSVFTVHEVFHHVHSHDAFLEYPIAQVLNYMGIYLEQSFTCKQKTEWPQSPFI